MAFTNFLRLHSVILAGAGSLVTLGQTIEITLTPSEHNGYSISCFGLKDGAIDATVTGGNAPYEYCWSNKEFTEDLDSIPAGYYALRVMDADSAWGFAEITLTEPRNMKIRMEPYQYPGRYNVSCFDCYNGSIDVTVYGGQEPYSYLWNDDVETEDRSALGAMKYRVKVTDNNGCESFSETIYLTQPDRNDWQMTGNYGTDPATHFFGTLDSQDVVFKSNATERLRLLGNGDISLLGNGAIGKGFLYLDEHGILKGGPYPYLPQYTGLCFQLESYPYWETRGNLFDNLCEFAIPKLGTRTAHPISVITNDVERMIITTDGKVGIGTTPPAVTNYRLFVEGGIATRDVLVKLGDWPDYVFQEGYHLLSLSELKDYLGVNHHLPGIPSAAEVDENGGVEVGDLQKRMLETIEQQALYILQLEERMKATEQRLNVLETSK